MDLEIEETSTSDYNAESGEFIIEYYGNTLPDVRIGLAIVLPDEYENEIRVIEGIEKSGQKLKLKTRAGNMCDLFSDINFTLTTNTSLLKSTRSTGRVITPSTIEWIIDNERYIVYNKDNMGTRDGLDVNHKIFSMSKDFKGDVLCDGDWGALQWQTCSFNADMDAVFSFDFGSVPSGKTTRGELNGFSCYLEGNVNIDMLLDYLIGSGHKIDKKEIIKKNILPTAVVRFMVGSVPVIVRLDTHLGKRISLEAEAEMEASTGIFFNSNTRVGMKYDGHSGMLSPVNSWEMDYGIHEPQAAVALSTEAEASFYPKLEMKLYNFIGPWIELIPYVGAEFNGDTQADTHGIEYVSTQASVFSGMDATVGLNLDCFFSDKKVTDPISIKGDASTLYETPVALEVKPKENEEQSLYIGRATQVTFNVLAQNHITGEFLPTRLPTVVHFSGDGKIASEMTLSDLKGEASVLWIPQELNDKLSATIYTSDKEEIKIEYAPQLEQGHQKDIQALKLLYESTGGDNWSINTNWLTDKPVDEWYGIGTENISDGILKINLPNNNLSGDAIIKGFVSSPDFNFLGNNLSSLTIADCHLVELAHFGFSSYSIYLNDNREKEQLWITNCSAPYGLSNNPSNGGGFKNVRADFLEAESIDLVAREECIISDCLVNNEILARAAFSGPISLNFLAQVSNSHVEGSISLNGKNNIVSDCVVKGPLSFGDSRQPFYGMNISVYNTSAGNIYYIGDIETLLISNCSISSTIRNADYYATTLKHAVILDSSAGMILCDAESVEISNTHAGALQISVTGEAIISDCTFDDVNSFSFVRGEGYITISNTLIEGKLVNISGSSEEVCDYVRKL